MIELLLEKLVTKVCGYLSPRDVMNLSMTSRFLYDVSVGKERNFILNCSQQTSVMFSDSKDLQFKRRMESNL